jgi:DNA repair protein RecO (recombination protein O)
MAELTDRMLADSDGEPYLYEQLKAAFLAMAEGKHSAIIVHIYELKLLQLAGYMPVLEQCASCGEPSGEMVFSVSSGGLLCRRCHYKDGHSIRITDSFLKLLRICATMDIRRLGQIQVKDETEIQLRQLIRAYYDAHAGLSLKSRHFLEQMEKYGV